jgi:tetratricopeptide (TPR) repeat protein
MQSEQHWWLRYGNYSPGLHNLPHMGEVIADHRRKRYRTQDEFATAVGEKLRNVQEWETNIMMTDMGRRILLAKLLKIPPALLGLTWHQVYSDQPHEDYTNTLKHMGEVFEEDAFYTYEDLLTLGQTYFYQGGMPQIAYRLNRRLSSLKTLTANALPSDREAWQTLLVRFHWLCGNFAQRHVSGQAMIHFSEALKLATELDDNQLICHSYHLLANEYEKQGKMKEANDAIQAALARVSDPRAPITPLKGNVYLRAAAIKGQRAGSSQKERDEARALQDKAANMLYMQKTVEGDITLLRFNLSAVNHEKAKLMLSFGQRSYDNGRALPAREIDPIQVRLRAAIDAVPSDLTAWKVYFHLTEARAYLAQHDIEASACAGKEALKAARLVNSERAINEIKELYVQLKATGSVNPHVDNLGLELGLI